MTKKYWGEKWRKVFYMTCIQPIYLPDSGISYPTQYYTILNSLCNNLWWYGCFFTKKQSEKGVSSPSPLSVHIYFFLSCHVNLQVSQEKLLNSLHPWHTNFKCAALIFIISSWWSERETYRTQTVPILFFYLSDTSQSSCNNTNTNSATGGGGLGGLSRHNSANDSNSSAMTPNVSDPGGHPGMDVNNTSGQLNHGCSNDENISQLSSPPKPVSTLVQHNYSNIHQPIPRGPTSLTSSRTQSSNTSPVLTGSPLNLNGEGGAFTKPQPSGQSTNTISSRPRTPPEERVARREKMVLEEAKKSRLADINDLIHLDSPITEDAVIRTLQSRYVNQKYVVSSTNFSFFSNSNS